MADYISREATVSQIFDGVWTKTDADGYVWVLRRDVIHTIDEIPAADVVEIPVTGIGDLSDGYHTFNGLYYQRMILFAALVRQNRDRAWKSYRHEDGELCFGGGWFIVGIDTPEGSYTYHYESKDFNLFDCEELPVGKHWDGHTEADVTRLLSLPAADVRPVVKAHWIYHEDDCGDYYECSHCHDEYVVYEGDMFWKHCPTCGAYMRPDKNGQSKEGG